MDEHVLTTYVRAEPRFVSGHGAEIVDESGANYLDLLGGIAVNALGHGHEGLIAALRDQVGKVLHVSNLFRHEHTEAVAEQLARHTGLDACFFCNSGAEANEAALKLARKWQRNRDLPERTGFVSLHGGFHGRTMGALSVTAYAPYREPFEPLIPGARYVPPDDVTALEAALRTDPAPAALILEPIQGEGGIRALDHGYLRSARALCNETGTLLIHDEVQCGTGRTGRFLAAQHADVKPDLVTLAKPLGCGLPIGVLVASACCETTLVPGDHGTTFGGGPLALRAARVLLDAIDDGLLAQVESRGTQFRDGLVDLQRRHDSIIEVRGRGLMLGVRLAEQGPALQRALFARRVITNCTAGDVVRFLPPYIITSSQIDRALDELDTALAAL